MTPFDLIVWAIAISGSIAILGIGVGIAVGVVVAIFRGAAEL